MPESPWTVRRATVPDAGEVAHLLDRFNREFDTPSPGPEVLTARLAALLAGTHTFALLSGEPCAGVALVTLRPNVWYPGPVALLDELYVVPEQRNNGIGSAIVSRLIADAHAVGVGLIEINVDESDVDAQRFYERHGFTKLEPVTGERAFYFSQELTAPTA